VSPGTFEIMRGRAADRRLSPPCGSDNRRAGSDGSLAAGFR